MSYKLIATTTPQAYMHDDSVDANITLSHTQTDRISARSRSEEREGETPPPTLSQNRGPGKRLPSTLAPTDKNNRFASTLRVFTEVTRPTQKQWLMILDAG